MDYLLTFSYWMVGAIVVYWVISLILVWDCVNNRRVLLTPRSKPELDTSRSYPKLSVIVAAKDEETNIESCLLTMLDQDYPDYELIVVDDRSTDRTPEILQQIEQDASGRLKVIRVEELKEGWFGKNNAMREGVEQSSGEWLCFIDADCWQTSKQTLSVAMQEALETETDFLSITPYLTMDDPWEKVVQPICVLTLMAWYHPAFVNNPRLKIAYANGQFMMMSRKCYQTIGGHERVRNEMNEDIILAVNTKEAGLKLRMTDNIGLFRSRMYSSISSAWTGWSRIFSGCLRSAPKLLLTIFVVAFYVVFPWVCLLAALVMRFSYGDTELSNQLLIVWGGACLSQLICSWHYCSIFEMNRIWSIAFPLGGLFAGTSLISALFKRLGLINTTWRGTTYCLDKRVDK